MSSISNRKTTLLSLLSFVAAGAMLAQAVGGPVPNWTVPPYQQARAEGGLRTMTDISPGIAFVAMQPCRVFDTRNANGPYGGPRLIANTARNFDIDSGPCGPIPAGVDAYSMNFGAILPDGANSFVTIWPAGSAQPLASSINPIQGTVVSNAAIVPAGTNGAISVFPNTGLHLYGDINGYFTNDFDNGTGNYFQVSVNSGNYAITGFNNSTSCSGTCGILSYTSSGNAIEGDAYENTTDENYGVYGYAASTNDFGAGVRGTASEANANGGYFSNSGAAITGASATFLATSVSGVAYSVYASHRILGGSLVISGLPKSFAAPHPEDASKEIRYASVEAPTVDVYFRGTGNLLDGIARIEIPDHFRYTAREGTYMTTLTPVGRSVTLNVQSEGPEGIVVRGSGNTRFHYVVYAERAEIEGFQPVIPNETFTPEALAKGNRLDALPASTKALLVKNGTLNADGTFNTETARINGWKVPEARVDPARNRPARQPAP